MPNAKTRAAPKTRSVPSAQVLSALVNLVVHAVARWTPEELREHDADLAALERYVDDRNAALSLPPSKESEDA